MFTCLDAPLDFSHHRGRQEAADQRHKGHGGEDGITPSFPRHLAGILAYPTLSCLTGL